MAVVHLEAERLIGLRKESVNHVEARHRLNVSPNVMNNLIESNLLTRHKQSMGPHAYRFFVSELDALLASVLSGASPIAPRAKSRIIARENSSGRQIIGPFYYGLAPYLGATF